jgi:hypothetical protein
VTWPTPPRSGGGPRSVRDGGPVRLRTSTDARSTEPPADLELVAGRRWLVEPFSTWVELAPGDRALVGEGEVVTAGMPIAERLRDRRLDEAPAIADRDPRRPGDRLAADPGGGPLRRAAAAAGEIVFRSGRRWRVATGDVSDLVEAPGAGIVREVRPGTGLRLDLAGRAIPGAFAVGVPTRGVLRVSADPSSDLHPAMLDVGLAGSILVVGSRVDAEMLTRARAMGVRGVVVASMSGKEARDFAASEARQRAALHRLPAFAVLVMDGVARRPLAGPLVDALTALAGTGVGIVVDPPALVLDPAAPEPASPDPAWVRFRHGPSAGQEGRWLGALGPRRFRPGLRQEAGLVRLEDGTEVAVPLADLERWA